jgi:hypothetical protein
MIKICTLCDKKLKRRIHICFGYPFFQWAWVCDNNKLHNTIHWIGSYLNVLQSKDSHLVKTAFKTKMDKINDIPRKYQP